MKILITGAAGRIGQLLVKNLADKHNLTLTDIDKPINTAGFPFKKANLEVFDSILELCKGQDMILHFGASPSKKAPWEKVLPNNIIGTYNVFEAAFRSKCKRVIFASSVNAVNGYPQDMQIHNDQTPNPHTLYGASKVWGEALARMYAEHKNMSIHCLRFGWVASEKEIKIRADVRNNQEEPIPSPDRIITHKDTASIVKACIKAPSDIKFGIFHALSNNRWKRLDISDTSKILNWKPMDDVFEILER